MTKTIVGLDVLDLDQKPGQNDPVRVVVYFSTRPSLLNRRLFSPLGDLGSAAATALLVVGAIFLVIEMGSLVTGIVMTRMDGDARGGAALSIKQVTGQPVKVVGVGEKYDAL